VPFPAAAAAVVRDDLQLLLLDKPSLSRRRFPIRQKAMVRRRSRSQTIVKQRPADQTTLVSWHHTKIAKIMGALGACQRR
jgi:hypothetical protein